jgi:VanZ family protein
MTLLQHCLNFIRHYWIAITALVLVAITILSLSPAEQIPRVAGSDKIHHIFAYALLMFPTALRQHRFYLLIALAFVLWSSTIEILQPYMNRYFEWMDIVANTTGILLAIILAKGLNKLTAYPQQPPPATKD